MLTVSDRTFAKEVLQSSELVLVHFWAPWCGLCRVIEPSLLKLQTESKGKIALVSINADQNFKLANQYRLRSLPTLLLFDRGQIIYRLEDFQGRESISQKLDKITFGLLAQSA
jgi:thioredoxin 1